MNIYSKFRCCKLQTAVNLVHFFYSHWLCITTQQWCSPQDQVFVSKIKFMILGRTASKVPALVLALTCWPLLYHCYAVMIHSIQGNGTKLTNYVASDCKQEHF